MAEGTFLVFVWKIENFSFWCDAVHGKCIKSPDFYCGKLLDHVELYPRGCSSQDDHMKVRFCDLKSDFIGDLAFAYSDGSSICSQQLKITQTVSELSVDLTFEEVIVQLRKADQKDEITLRFCVQSDLENEQRMCSTISVWKVSYKIDPEVVERLESSKPINIIYFRHTSKKGRGVWLTLARQNERVQLALKPYVITKSILVESSLTMLSDGNSLFRNEEGKHVFIDEKTWTFSESLTVKELKESGITILLGLKVVNGEIVKRHNNTFVNTIVSIVPNNSTLCVCEQKPSNNRATPNQADDSVTVLIKDFMCLYQDQDFSDFQLKCGDVTFRAHKAVLSARSPVFKTMLSTDMTETASGQVVIEDLDPSTLCLFLIYLYTGTVEDLTECGRALKLYYAADKYQVPSLKGVCTDFLCANVSMSSVCDILSLANRHNDEYLTAASHSFMLTNYNGLLRSEEWKNFMDSEPVLAVKTLTQFSERNSLTFTPLP